MALVAKIFGFLCMFGAVFEVLLAGILIVTADGGSTSSDSGSDLYLSPSAAGFGVLVLALPVLAFLLLFTVGAAAYVVGDMAERQVGEHRRAVPPPVDRAYGASLRS